VQYLKTYSPSQVIIANTEYTSKLQRAAYKQNQTIPEDILTISAQKTKLVAFKGQDPATSTNVIDNRSIEQVNSLTT